MAMMIPTDLDPRLGEAVRRLVELFRPERVYLFGSRARGEAKAHSDYDLLVVVAHADEPGYRLEQEGYGVLFGLGISIDLLVWTRDDFEFYRPVVASLPATVAREGRLLYAA